MIICGRDGAHTVSTALITFLDFGQKLVNVDNIHNRESNVFQHIEMMVFRNDEFSICSNGTIDKFIVIGICCNKIPFLIS